MQSAVGLQKGLGFHDARESGPMTRTLHPSATGGAIMAIQVNNLYFMKSNV